ncbi:hypothetical protein G7072_02040 [Nocardioides sp. HDW12B]|uniref:divisome protein SepX/GlpR n=1 Tax=Nocardioides sp. HDW12B TaxID=2714939 RepID=UPI00140C5A79|nr:hypothetical protein [Nocardioides sp. HDW12B]QIK65282.1 hypothetical protein G7072_02040 [Nocardioides sp. HDW12B]
MDMSGLIFVALAAVWAVVLIPMALRHHDEAARTRAVDNFSDDLRVVARREAVNTRESRLVVPSRLRRTPSTEASATTTATDAAPSPSAAGAAGATGATTDRPVAGQPSVPAPRRTGPRDGRPAVPVRAIPAQRRASARRAHRAAARAAAKRRRVVLGLLLLVTLGVSVGSLTGVLLPWAPAVPAAVVVGFLALARVLARRELRAWQAVVGAEEETAAPQAPAAPLVVADLPRFSPAITVPVVPPVSVVSGLDDTAGVPVGLAAAAPSTPVEGLWDPLPVTLPTYVTKPRAHRSVRTIDLLEPGVVSSGRNAADSALVAEAATARPAQAEQHRDRAVGS